MSSSVRHAASKDGSLLMTIIDMRGGLFYSCMSSSSFDDALYSSRSSIISSFPKEEGLLSTFSHFFPFFPKKKTKKKLPHNLKDVLI